MTYGKFLEKYSGEIDLLDVYDQYGYEVPEDFTIPINTKVTQINQRGGYFDITLDIDAEQAIPSF